MILEPQFAQAFITSYKQVLLAAADEADAESNGSLLSLLAKGRVNIAGNAEATERMLGQLAKQGLVIEPEVKSAILNMRVQKWIYLRDTRSHSIFLDLSEDEAYGVVGLTDRLRKIVGASGAIIETGVTRYRDRFVCDGLITEVVWLGPNYRRDFNDVLASLKARGRLHVKPE